MSYHGVCFVMCCYHISEVIETLPSSHVFPPNPVGHMHLNSWPSGPVRHEAPCAHG